MAKDITEKVRQLRSEGVPEEDAIRQAAAPEDAESEESDDTDEEAPDISEASRQFVIVTKDFSGLGWAKTLQSEGEDVVIATDYAAEEDPDFRKMMRRVGEGWVDVLSLSEALTKYRTESTYWVMAENCFPEFVAKLRAADQKVFPPNFELGEELEHDRNKATDLADSVGLAPPSTHEFSATAEALSFLDDNPDTAYVFKPDSSEFNYMTFVPARKADTDANREVYTYLEHLTADVGSFVLQERIPKDEAIEVNVELWLQDGVPFLALLGLELKRKNPDDLGEMTGCAGDFVQIIPLDCKLVTQTVGKLLPFYEDEGYSGFADVNVLITKDGQPYFLEVCNRFGYNAHVTMLLGLLKGTYGDFIADYVEGNTADFGQRFTDQVAGSLCLFLDHPRDGLPIHVDPAADARWYPFDGREEEGQMLLTGYTQEIGILVDTGSDIPSVAAKLVDQLRHKEAVSVPDLYYRTDTDCVQQRMTALKSRGLL